MKVKILKKDIKNFFCKKFSKENVTTKRILGFTSRYARGRVYQDYIKTLEYLKPYIKESIDNVLSDFKLKSKRKKNRSR